MKALPDLSGDIRPFAHLVDARRRMASKAMDILAEAHVERLIEEEHHRAEEREARRSRRWAPPWRCEKCHRYTSGARAVCKGCGHVGATNDEGQRTSYLRAHARRQRAKRKTR